MRIFNLGLSAMFLVFAFLQVNDPDPIVWILIYGAMAAVSVMAAYDYYIRPLMIIQFIAYLVYCGILTPGFLEWLRSSDRSLLFDDLAKMQHLYIEEAREFLGLWICIVVLILYWWRSSKAPKKTH